MKRLVLFIASAIVLFAFCTSRADDKFDPAAQATFLAPYIDEQTFLIVHLDLSKVKIDSGLDALSRLLPDDKEEILQSKAVLQQMMDLCVKTIGKDLYLAIRANSRDAVLIVIPLGDKYDQQAVEQTTVFNPLFKYFSFKIAGNVIFGRVANARAYEQLDKITPDTRPDLAAAFETAGQSAIQVLLLPPRYSRRVIEETMPQLPKEIGGGSTSAVTKGLSWAVLGINFTPQITARLVIQSPDAPSAAALNTLFEDVLKHVAELPGLKQQLPTFAELIPHLTPKPEGDKLVLNIDEKNAELSNLLGKLQMSLFSEVRDSVPGGHNQ